MIRILIVLEATLGGIRKHVVDLLLGLKRDQFEITFVFSKERADQTFLMQLPLLAANGIRLIELPMRRDISPPGDARALLRLISILRRYPPDVLHLHGAKAGALGRVAARILGFKNVIYNPHGGSFHKFSGLKGRLYLTIERLLSVEPVHFIGVSADSCKDIEQLLKVKKERITKIYNGVDLPGSQSLRGRAEFKSMHDIADSKFLVLYPAVFLESKGHLEFIEAARAIKPLLKENLVIALAGDGPLRKEIVQRISAYGLTKYFRLLGFVTDLSAAYSACNLVVLPSRNEVFGYVLLEAMSYSKAILATAVGGIPEIVVHGYNGELFDSNKLEAMMLRIVEVSEDDTLLTRYEANANVRLSDFTKASMLDKTKELYLRLPKANA